MRFIKKDSKGMWLIGGPLETTAKEPQLMHHKHYRTKWGSEKQRLKRIGAYQGGKLKAKVF